MFVWEYSATCTVSCCGRSLAIENWKHNALQENRAEEEVSTQISELMIVADLVAQRIEAMLLDGEQRVKKIMMLREERK